MLRKIMCAIVGLTAAVLTMPAMASAAPSTPAAVAAPADCPITPYGLIGDKWWQMGGVNSPLGCAAEQEHDVAGRHGRAQQFAHGGIVWSPDQGSGMILAAYQSGHVINIQWGPTNPFSYNKYIVRWDRNGGNIGQQDVLPGSVTTGGGYTIGLPGPGRYDVVVEGCDYDPWSGSTCRQGWTIPATVFVS